MAGGTSQHGVWGAWASRCMWALCVWVCLVCGAAVAVAQDQDANGTAPKVTSDTGTPDASKTKEGEGDAKDAAPGIPMEDALGMVVSDIRVSGLGRTEESVILRELLIKVGEPITEDAYTESVQRLWNLPMFRKVEDKITRDAMGNAVVSFHFEEKWTILPIARFGGGGASLFFILGLYDINFLGRYLEVGSQYENLNGQHSGVVWFRDPRFLNQRLRLGLEFWWTNRIRWLYTPEGVQEGAYVRQRIRPRFFLDKEVSRMFGAIQLGVGAEYNQDVFTEQGLSDEDRAINANEDYVLPPGGRSVIGELRAVVGRLNYEDFLVDGTQVTAIAQRSFETFGADFAFTNLTLEALNYWRLPLRANLASRVTLGWTDSDAIQYQFFAGGLDITRGFLDGQFRGSTFWQSNLEYRIPSLDSSWVVLQHAVFVDVSANAPNLAGAFDERGNPVASLGGGIRLFSPRIARATLRLDYAAAFGTRFVHGVSFSASQFF